LKETKPLHRTTFLKTLIRNTPIFAQKLGQNDQFFNVYTISITAESSNYWGDATKLFGVVISFPIHTRFVITDFRC